MTHPTPTGIRGAISDVLRFHESSGDSTLSNRDPHPPALVRRMMRLRLLREELTELEEAVENNDICEVADAYADIIYIALGSAIMHIGVERFCRIWDEVHRSNMAKVIGGRLEMREDGKIMKPEGWQPPDIRRAMDGEMLPMSENEVCSDDDSHQMYARGFSAGQDSMLAPSIVEGLRRAALLHRSCSPEEVLVHVKKVASSWESRIRELEAERDASSSRLKRQDDDEPNKKLVPTEDGEQK